MDTSNLRLIKGFGNDPPDFATAYDNFIGETETECIEGILCKLAKGFYNAGYRMGRLDEREGIKDRITGDKEC